jgi:hypothetical protein
MAISRVLPRARWLALALAGFLLLGAAAALTSSAQTSRMGSLSTISLCVRKAGPEKGAVRFVQGKQPCRAGELRVEVLSNPSTQDVIGFREGGAASPSSLTISRPPASASAGVSGYVRVEGISPEAAGTPETATATVSCPGEAEVLSGGYRVNADAPGPNNDPGEIAVTESRATTDSTWAVTAFAADAGGVGPWSVSAYAICADLSG